MRRCRPLLGTFVEIESDRPEAIEPAFAAIEAVHALMSAHSPDSELSRINRFAHGASVAVSDWTAAVIERALHWSRLSEGCFDVVRAGRIALERRLLPRHVGQHQPGAGDWTLIELRKGMVSLAEPACLDLGGIAKGFAVDRAIDALKTGGATRGLVNAGGDLRGFGAGGWTIDVVDPVSRRALAVVTLDDGALATSAGVARRDGALCFDHLPSHDPRLTSVTVRAPLACDADALTKIIWSGNARAGEWLRSVGAEAFVLRTDSAIAAIDVEALAA